MELKTGYKQTEVGVIPSDWEVKELREVAQFASGTTPRRELHERYFIHGNIFWVKTMDLNNADIHDTSEKVTEVAMKETSSLKIFPVNTVLIAMYGGFNQIGRTGILKISACVNQAITAIKPDNNCLSPQFLIGFLNYRVDYWKDVATSSRKDPNITSKDVKNFKIAIPTLTEQNAIATALSDADQYIALLEKLIAKKRNIKQGALQELLKPKEGWVVKKLGEMTKVFTKQTGFDYTSYIKPSLVQYRTDDTIPFIQNKDFNNKWINFDTDYFIPKSVALQFPKILLNEKSLLISISGSVGNVGLYDSKEISFIGGAVAILKFKEPDLIDWVMFYLKSDEGQKKLLNNVKAGSHQNLILDDIRKIEIVMPTVKEQTRIATILNDIDAEITTLETKLDKAQSIKQGMMQQLLTGKIRLIN